jgi:glutathione synthase/RimK-type ligase-like ATP-grasp enzyme
MESFAFVTYAKAPELTADDRVAADELRSRGVEVFAAAWDDPNVAWDEFDVVVLRSCWNYHLHAARFLEWVGRLAGAGVPVVNRPDVVRWNFEKTYLRDLAQRGVPVVPTVWLDRGDDADLAAILERERWPRAVVKPTVSLSAYRTWITSPGRAEADGEAVRELLARGGVMVQPFVDEVVTEGEWSFVFFGGEYSHAVLKRPAAGDFRVQSDFGGAKTLARPEARLVAAARAALDAAGGPLPYARVDAVESGGGLLLMELELIDPELFFSKDPGAAERFARALAAV